MDLSEARHPTRVFRRVVTDFSLDGERRPKASGYRGLWRFRPNGGDSVLIGMCVMSVIDANAVQPGETRRVAWEFAPPAQGYIEFAEAR